MGGGGAQGQIDFPPYMKDTHHNWITGDPYDVDREDNDILSVSLVSHMETSLGSGGNPYEGEVPYNPGISSLTASKEISSLTSNSPLDRMRAAVLASNTFIGTLDPEVDFASYLATVKDEYDNFDDIDLITNLSTAVSGIISALDTALNTSYISDLVQKYQTEKETRFLRDVGLWSAGMADINAVHTSSYIMGLALLQMDFANSVDKYSAELKQDIYSNVVKATVEGQVRAEVMRVGNKDNMLQVGANVMAQIKHLKAQLTLQQASLTTTQENILIGNSREYVNRQLAIDIDETMWPYKIYQTGGNILNSITGAAGYVPDNSISDAQATLGGAASGAAIGAESGAGWVGAVVGAVVGGIGGYFGNQ